jgi:hypothetical protein
MPQVVDIRKEDLDRSLLNVRISYQVATDQKGVVNVLPVIRKWDNTGLMVIAFPITFFLQ